MKAEQVAELQGLVNNAGLSSVAPLLDADIVLAQSMESAMAQPISYRTVKVDGLSIFYREAGPKNTPTILLLHGLPSSSRMFEPLLTRLAGQFHMVAPDYPGFGHSDAPTQRRSRTPSTTSPRRWITSNGHGPADRHSLTGALFLPHTGD
jgi:hypothetical protein